MQDAVHNKMAQQAYKCVQSIVSNPKSREFRSLARSFPSTIQVNGLAAAVAFLFSKKKQSYAHIILYNAIDDWTKNKFSVESKTGSDLMNRITNMDSACYRLYTDECMNLCLWIKRFAEGMIENEQNKPHQTNQS